MNSQFKTSNICGLAEDLLINLPIEAAALEYHDGLDKLAFVFEDVGNFKEIEGESGASILVSGGKLIGFTLSNFSHFTLNGCKDPESVFMEVCLQYPDFAGDLYRLIGAFEMSQV